MCSVTVEGQIVADGELDAPVTSDECCWVLEKTDSGAPILVISLPKAKPQTWKRLFKAEAR